MQYQSNKKHEAEQEVAQSEVGGLTKKERRQLKKQRKQEERQKEQRKSMIQKLLSIAVVILIIGGGIFAVVWFMPSRSHLPPTIMQGHIEQSPPAHIVDQPIPDLIQRHMLEHADGRGKPGVIIQYNCKDFDCEPDIVQKLTALVRQYPANVYLAPNNYDGKIILTKLGKREILDNFDEQVIKNFIE